MTTILEYTDIHPIGNSDPQNMPVADVDKVIPYYENTLGFTLKKRGGSPHKSATLTRDKVTIRLVESGGDPEQASCYIEVSDVDAAHAELERHSTDIDNVRPMEHDGKSYRVFFLRDNDGLCYCIGTRQASS